MAGYISSIMPLLHDAAMELANLLNNEGRDTDEG